VYILPAGTSKQEIVASRDGAVPKGLGRLIPSKNLTIEGGSMPHFLTQVSYTEHAWQALVSNPQNRMEAIRPAIEKLGGRIVNSWFAFGDYDVVLITEFPNNVSAAALSIAAAAGGACKSIKTTPLMDTAEGLEALKKAAASGYQPPSMGRTAKA
jgi:uncharacterized protein with GYD domain